LQETQAIIIKISTGLSIFYLSLMVIEAWWSHHTGKKVYTLKEAWASLSAGVIHQALNLVFPLAAKSYFLVWAYKYAPFQFERGWLHFLIAFLLTDLFYYLQHRLNHTVGIFWSMHQAHHSSKELNLSTGARVSWLTPFVSAFFFAPLSLLGLDPHYILISLICIFYGQWWCHTQFIGKLGVLDKILNTPSLHRVHHSPIAKFRGSNFAGFLCIWDRMFGTYIAEEEQITKFGVGKHQGYNPFVINLGSFINYLKIFFRRGEQTDAQQERTKTI
jgi:alkylglycerol monooxygenase